MTSVEKATRPFQGPKNSRTFAVRTAGEKRSHIVTFSASARSAALGDSAGGGAGVAAGAAAGGTGVAATGVGAAGVAATAAAGFSPLITTASSFETRCSPNRSDLNT